MKNKLLCTIAALSSIYIFAQNVGINTNSPAATLDVNGTMAVRKLPPQDNSEKQYTLVVSKSNAEVKKAISNSGNNYSISSIQFELSNVSGDNVSNFDTKIPYTDYILVVCGATFSDGTNNTGMKTIVGGSYNPLNIKAFQALSAGVRTWRLTADYSGGNTQSGKNGTWTINALVFNRAVIREQSRRFVTDMGGKSTGTIIGGAVPTGL